MVGTGPGDGPQAPDPTQVPADERVALEELAVALVAETGALIRDERPDGLGVAHTKSTDLDVVTEMDTRAESLLRERLATARPGDGVLGEEDGLTAGRTGLSWVVDPIDGTVNYLYDLPAYAVSVAVVVGDPTTPGAWTPVAGAVINPRTDEIFHGRVGAGSRVTARGVTRALSVGGQTELEGALLATGFSYDRQIRRGQASIVADLVPRVRDVRRMGAAALDLCHVAAGRVDGYWERGLQAWDLAAGLLILAEAGGVASGQTAGSPASADLVVAANPVLQPVLRGEIERLGHRL
ncbi:inositol monophosphatase family protein [Serinicoccus kebangsaanensis]|uniref:inositol monophosphatase family protein n=1 Tax=Serinicoccus kebangsaanensis TaxID=2602069 RepID=UPI00124CABA1|nr:inositol monophosphatase family protein [Serinicoccus kebangsaanensis]